jgi:putative holliday junction resolvase
MIVLGIDYGLKKVGLAVGDTDSRLAEPLRVVRYSDIEILKEEIKKVFFNVKAEKVVVGVSEGKMAEMANSFGKNLEKYLNTSVVFQDETLSTHDAMLLSIEAGMSRKKRKGMEDAFAAAIMLQNYLESRN